MQSDPAGIDATRLDGRESSQEWGSLGTGASVLGKRLSVGGKPYSKGFGTHTASNISLPIPEGSQTFTTLVGVDDEAFGEAEFRILADGNVIWQSGLVKKGETARLAKVAVNGKRKLELVVDPQGTNYGDHVDWLDPRFKP